MCVQVFDPQEVLALGSERIEALRRAVRDDLVTWNSTGTLTPTGPLTATSKTLQANFTVRECPVMMHHKHAHVFIDRLLCH